MCIRDRDITNEIDRESKIIEDLLSLVKMDKSAAVMNISSVNVNEMLEIVLKLSLIHILQSCQENSLHMLHLVKQKKTEYMKECGDILL